MEGFGRGHVDSIGPILCNKRDATDKVFRHVALSEVAEVEGVESPVYMGTDKEFVGDVVSGTDIGIEIDKKLGEEVVLSLSCNTVAAVLARDAGVEAHAYTSVDYQLLSGTIGEKGVHIETHLLGIEADAGGGGSGSVEVVKLATERLEGVEQHGMVAKIDGATVVGFITPEYTG